MARKSYEVLDTESGDVLASYSSLESARRAVESYVGRHPHLANDIAIVEINGRGRALQPGEKHGN